MALTQDRAVFVTANGINKTLKQAIIDGNIGGGGGGGGATQLFNIEILMPSSASTVTGFIHCRVPFTGTISLVAVTIFNKNGVATGTFTVDIKKNNSPDDTGMTSIFSDAPSFDFSVDADYATKSGTLSSSSITAGDWLRIDVTSSPTNWGGTFHVSLYA